MKNLNEYQRLIAGVLQPPHKSTLSLNHRRVGWAVCLATLLPVAAFLIVNYPLQAAFVILLACSVLVISREHSS